MRTSVFERSASQKQYLIKAGQFYDARKNVFVKDQQLLISGTRIVEVGSSLQVPANTQVPNFLNATVAPGLIDAHTQVPTTQGVTVELAADAIIRSAEHRACERCSIWAVTRQLVLPVFMMQGTPASVGLSGVNRTRLSTLPTLCAYYK